MTSSGDPGGQPARGSRRFLWLSVAILAAMAAYSGFWLWLAGQVESRAEAAMAAVRERGGEAACSNLEARGYPFRVGLFCDALFWADRNGVSLRGSGLRSAAQFYDPFRIVGELDEAWFEMGGLGPGVGTNLRGLRFSARLDRPLPERASLVSGPIVVDETPLARSMSAVLSAEGGEAHLRRNGTAVDLALSASRIELSGPRLGRPLRLASASADLSVEDGVRLASERPRSLRGIAAVVRSLALDLDGEAGVSLSGPVSVDPDGLVDARLSIALRNPARISALLAEMFPDQEKNIRSVFSGLVLLGDNPSLPLTIRKGRAQIGFIPVGVLAPLR